MSIFIFLRLYETTLLLLKMGMSVEEIAQQLNVELEAVQLAAQQNT